MKAQILLYCEFAEGEKSLGRQKKRSKDTLKADMKDFGIDPAHQSSWRSRVYRGTKKYEQAEMKREKDEKGKD